MIITSDILASSSKSTDPCQDGHDVVDGEHYEDDVDVIDSMEYIPYWLRPEFLEAPDEVMEDLEARTAS